MSSLPVTYTGKLHPGWGGNKRKVATELKISAQKYKTGVIAAISIPYENIPFVPLLKQTNKGSTESKHEPADTSSFWSMQNPSQVDGTNLCCFSCLLLLSALAHHGPLCPPDICGATLARGSPPGCYNRYIQTWVCTQASVELKPNLCKRQNRRFLLLCFDF